jgi:acyl carrier protein
MPESLNREDVTRIQCRMTADRTAEPAITGTPDSHHEQDPHFDCLDRVEYMMEIEERFGIRVPDERAGAI